NLVGENSQFNTGARVSLTEADDCSFVIQVRLLSYADLDGTTRFFGIGAFTNSIGIGLARNGSFTFQYRGDSTTNPTISSVTGKWVTLAGTYRASDGQVKIIAVDDSGVRSGVSTFSGVMLIDNASLRIGSAAITGSAPNGY